MKKLTLLLVAAALGASAANADSGHDPSHHAGVRGDSPLVAKVYNANKRFADINVAMAEGWVQGTPCVSGPEFGAMGVHFLQMDRLNNAVLQAEYPTALIYEPQEDGGYRLVGVEYIILKDVWEANPKNMGVPVLDGNLLNFVGEPNRYGLHAFYELHIWAFEHNPLGSYADWNTRVVCTKQPDKHDDK
jgi:hypothetical protein